MHHSICCKSNELRTRGSLKKAEILRLKMKLVGLSLKEIEGRSDLGEDIGQRSGGCRTKALRLIFR